MKKRDNFDVSVYVVIDPPVCGGRAVEEVAAMALRGGASIIQLRNKVDPLAIVKDQAHDIKSTLADSSVSFIINDHVELAAEINADGVHIGQGDMAVIEVRKIIGNDKILGLTAFTKEHYSYITSDVIDYVGTGPVYPTLTKPDKAVLGIDGFAKLAKDSPIPVVGIGGITPQNAGAVIKAGASGVAMMRAVSEVENPEQAVRDFVNSVKEARLVHH